MSIKPALGWLALFLFATTAQAEGARDLFKLSASSQPAAVIRKTKAAPVTPAVAVAPASGAASALAVVESVMGKPRADYEAEAFSQAANRKESYVTMVFERQRRASFRVSRDRIHRLVRLEAKTADGGRRGRDHVDVLDTEDGVVVIDTVAHGDGLFTASDIYTFARGASLEQRIGMLGREPAAPARIREALVAAEWSR